MSVLDYLKSPVLRVPEPLECTPEILELPDPEKVIIPLEYPGQILFRPLVPVGAEVAKNQIIGLSGLGNYIHASISGKVTELKSVWSARSFHVPAVVIEKNDIPPLQGREILRQCGIDPKSATRLELFKAAGVISPWTTPGHDDSEIDIEGYPEISQVVIKGINQEPTICSFSVLLRTCTKEVQGALRQLGEILPQARVFLTVSRADAQWAEDVFSGLAEVVSLPNDYRGRIERPAMARLTGLKVKGNAPFRSCGLAVISTEQLLDMDRALKGHPCIRKAVTISCGDGAPPVTVRAAVGTTMRDLLASQGLTVENGDRVILGGPMAGTAQFTLETSLSKFQAGIHLQRAKDVLSDLNHTCINCGRCTQACPVNLQVHLIGRFVEYDQLFEANQYHPEACLKCGLCAFVCPSHRPLLQLINLASQYGS
jgi:H+/Na+-translocating ferredoxin:NAD+ oxidoreductase subunit C